MHQILFVFLGGGLGSLCRYGIGLGLAAYKLNFPVATLLSNLLACLLMGWVVGLNMKGKISPTVALLFTTGFCGGFSTFSAFTNETFQLLQSGMLGRAALNVAGTFALCFAALWAGMRLSD